MLFMYKSRDVQIIQNDDFDYRIIVNKVILKIESLRIKWFWKSNHSEKKVFWISKLHSRFTVSSGYKTVKRMYTSRCHLILILEVDNQIHQVFNLLLLWEFTTIDTNWKRFWSEFRFYGCVNATVYACTVMTDWQCVSIIYVQLFSKIYWKIRIVGE